MEASGEAVHEGVVAYEDHCLGAFPSRHPCSFLVPAFLFDCLSSCWVLWSEFLHWVSRKSLLITCSLDLTCGCNSYLQGHIVSMGRGLHLWVLCERPLSRLLSSPAAGRLTSSCWSLLSKQRPLLGVSFSHNLSYS